VGGLTRQLHRLQTIWRSLRGSLGYLGRRRRQQLRRPIIDYIEIYRINQEMNRIRDRMNLIRYTQIPDIQQQIDEERERISMKTPPPPINEERIADEECTGYDINFDLDYKDYTIRDPDTNELIRREQKIAMELTASIDTNTGHDVPVVVEITCTTYVEEMSLAELIKAEHRVEKSLRGWLISQNWGNLIQAFIKEGVAYNSEEHVNDVVRYPWTIPDYPDVHTLVEKKRPRARKYEGDFTVG
jgi:hypothetical protein